MKKGNNVMSKVSKEHKLKVIESQKKRRIEKARKNREKNFKSVENTKLSGLTKRYVKKQIQNVFEADSTAAVRRAEAQKRKYFNNKSKVNTYKEGK